MAERSLTSGAPERSSAGALRPGRPRLSRPSAPWVFLAPALILFVIIFVIPIGYTLQQSFLRAGEKTSIFGGNASPPVFAGVDQYLAAFDDSSFLLSIARVGLIGAVQVPLMIMSATVLALFLDSRRIRGRQAFQLSYFLPYAIPGVVSALMWTFLLQPDLSPFTAALQAVGADVDFTSRGLAPWSIGNMIIWGFTGYNMVVIYSSLKALPAEVIEAATVDGAGPWRQAWSIKVPMVMPTITMMTIFSIIGTIQLYNEPAILRNAAPQISPDFSPIMSVYRLVSAGDLYGASARSLILAVTTLVVSFTVLRFQQRQGSAFHE